MNITKLKQALEIMGCDGAIFAYHEELRIYPNEKMSNRQCGALDELGFIETDQDDGFVFFC